MRSPSFIINSLTTETRRHRERQSKSIKVKREIPFYGFTFLLLSFRFSHSVTLCLCGVLLFLASHVSAQRIAVLTPEPTAQAKKYASEVSDRLSTRLKVLDDEMSQAAFHSVKVESPMNLSARQAQAIGDVLGCDYFMLLKTGTLRRSSFAKDEFYESFVTAFLVNGRSGRLVYWGLKSFESVNSAESERLLFTSTGSFTTEIIERLGNSRVLDAGYKNATSIEEMPDAGTATGINFRPPMPYKRIKPEYTRMAYYYDIRATVDVTVDIDRSGAVKAVEIERWAGYGLDESVIAAVRKMNWRPAERNGRTLPMRVLLRYNFTKIEKE